MAGFLAALLILATSPDGGAAQTPARDRAQARLLMRQDAFFALAPGAETVIVAAVTAKRSYWSADRTLIYTDYQLATKSRLRGATPANLTLTVEGGEVGDVGLRVSHAVRLETNATYAVLLERGARGLEVRGGAQGAKRLTAVPERDPVVRDLALVLRHGKR